jgi:glycine hydroxymethyltransferase
LLIEKCVYLGYYGGTIMKNLQKIDSEIAQLIKKEEKRQNETIDLIASENHISEAQLEAVGSRLTDKYSEGYPGERYYPGNMYYDAIEKIAQRRGLALFGLSPNEWHLNVQPLSGSPANTAIYLALAEPGETIMGLKLTSGGHLTHGHKVSISGKVWKSVQFDVDHETGLLDYDAIERLAESIRPKIIISGFTAYPSIVDFRRFGKIAKQVGAYHLADMSHIAGLVAGGAYPSPFAHADVVMTTTHKSLRGPRGAVIFCKKELSEQIDKAVFPGIQGGPHNNVIAAKAVCFKEAASPKFRKYAKQVVNNAKALAYELTQLGLTLVSDGTDSHLMLVDVRALDIDGKEAEARLEKVGIMANKNTIPGDIKPLKPSGIRIGTPAVTTRGMEEKEMKKIAVLIRTALAKQRPVAQLRKEVLKLCKKFPIKHGAL